MQCVLAAYTVVTHLAIFFRLRGLRTFRFRIFRVLKSYSYMFC